MKKKPVSLLLALQLLSASVSAAAIVVPAASSDAPSAQSAVIPSSSADRVYGTDEMSAYIRDKLLSHEETMHFEVVSDEPIGDVQFWDAREKASDYDRDRPLAGDYFLATSFVVTMDTSDPVMSDGKYVYTVDCTAV